MNTITTLQERLKQKNIDALLVSTPSNVRYLSGFSSPEDGVVYVSQDEAILYTDGRYTAQAAEEVAIKVDIRNRRDYYAHIAKDKLGGRVLAFEQEHLSYGAVERLQKELAEAKQPVARASKDLIESLRLRKSPQEIELLRQAAALTDKAFEHILNFIKVGVSEVELALELEAYMRKAGAEGKSFDFIVASGVRGAMPHGTASQKTLQTGELITFDFGAKVDGYHADMTRTVALGELSDAHTQMYHDVLESQVAALQACKAGITGKALDAVARDILKAKGHGEAFAHSLGHGVGLDIHEGPGLSQYSEDVVLEPGMAVTIEPGIYYVGDTGLRIEDLVVVTEDGCERLSHSTKELLHL